MKFGLNLVVTLGVSLIFPTLRPPQPIVRLANDLSWDPERESVDSAVLDPSLRWGQRKIIFLSLNQTRNFPIKTTLKKDASALSKGVSCLRCLLSTGG